MFEISKYQNSLDAIRDWYEINKRAKDRITLRMIVKKTKISLSVLSEIINGQRLPTLEQSFLLGKEMGLIGSKLKHFIYLVERDRTANRDLKIFFDNILNEKKSSSQTIGLESLSELEKFKYYSKWVYGAVRLMILIPEYGTSPGKIASRLGLTKEDLNEALSFLLQTNLISKADTAYKPGVKSTHVEAHSALSTLHHVNWRMKTIENIPARKKDDFHYTWPIVISHKTFKEARLKVENLLLELSESVRESPEEELFCLNIDCFQV